MCVRACVRARLYQMIVKFNKIVKTKFYHSNKLIITILLLIQHKVQENYLVLSYKVYTKML